MIEFNTSQLTWIVVGALGIGGTGYLNMDNNIQQINTKLEVSSQKLNEVERRMVDLQVQLNRIEDKINQNNR